MTVAFAPPPSSVTAADGTAPSNDDYADAEIIDGLPHTATADMSEASFEPLERMPSCFTSPGGPAVLPNATAPSVWYRFEPQADVRVTIDTGGSDGAILSAVWEGQDLVTQQEVGCKRDPAGDRITVQLEAGSSYAIHLLHFGEGSTVHVTVDESDAPGIAEILPFEVAAEDGTPLRGHVYLPEGEGPFAPVLEFSPYWNTVYGPSEDFTDAKQDGVMAGWLGGLLEAGFAVALVNMRGTGESGGCMQWFGPQDATDVATVIEALAAADWSTGNVGMYGVSAPGWTQMLALASGAPSLEAVVPASPVTDIWNLLTYHGAAREQGTARPLVFGTLVRSGALSPVANQTGRPFVPDVDPRHESCPRYVEEAEISPPAWNGDRTDWFDQRDLRPHLEGSDVPVFATVGLHTIQGETGQPAEGHITQLDGIWDLLDGDRRFMLGQWGHGFPTRPDFDELAVAWLDQHLRGQGRRGPGTVRSDVVEYEDDGGVWHTARSWPPRARDATLWLGDDDLVVDRDAVTPSTRSFQSTDQVPCAGTCVRPSGERLPGCNGDHLVYVSEPLAEEVVVAGHYTVDLTVESTLPDGTVASFLYHTDADDPCEAATLDEAGQAITDLRHVFTDEGADFPVGTPTDISITSEPLAARIPAGHRLVLTVGSAGWITEPDPMLPRLTVTTGHEAVSALTLPLVIGRLGTPVPPQWAVGAITVR